MRKWISGFIIFLFPFICACSTHQPSLNQQEILNGDFSSISGTYKNPDGEEIQLNEDGLRWFEHQTGEIRCSEQGFCSMGIHGIGSPDGGYALSIYPAGMEVQGLNTDISKIRICYGQAEPMSEKEIYTYFSDKIEPVVIESEYQAFIMKGYYSALTEASSPYALFNPHVESGLVTLNGVEISVNFNTDQNHYQLNLEREFSYDKDEVKKAHLYVTAECLENQNISYVGKLIISDGQTFYLRYDDAAQMILNDDPNSNSTGQSMNFINSVNSEVLSQFEEAKHIAEAHFPVLAQWQNELSAVKNNEITFDEMKTGYLHFED